MWYGTQVEYDRFGAEKGQQTLFSYFDTLNRKVLVSRLNFAASDYIDTDNIRFDSFGQVIKAYQPYERGVFAAATSSELTYDILGRVVTERRPSTDSGTVLTSTDYTGLSTTVTVSNLGGGSNMPQGQTQSKTVVKNPQGQTVSVTDAASKVITYTYDAFGSLITTDAAGIVTSLTYDLRGRKTAMADPDMGNWTYEYDALGQLRRQTDAKAQVSTIAYDKLSRMVSGSNPTSTAPGPTTPVRPALASSAAHRARSVSALWC